MALRNLFSYTGVALTISEAERSRVKRRRLAFKGIHFLVGIVFFFFFFSFLKHEGGSFCYTFYILDHKQGHFSRLLLYDLPQNLLSLTIRALDLTQDESSALTSF